jgi:hypothetical protein
MSRTGRPVLRRVASACAGLAVLAGPAPAGTCPDLALVLAVDGSGSINTAEFVLQTRGIAAALGDPRVGRAIAAAGDVRMAAVLWGDRAVQPQIVPWQEVGTTAGRAAFAQGVAGQPRRVYGNTDLGSGLALALDQIAAGAPCAARSVVDVSGDGRDTDTPERRSNASALVEVRLRAGTMGVTVNALAIIDKEPDLPAWYRIHLVTGPGAFVVTVADHGDFVEAMADKLVREIAPPLLTELSHPVLHAW